MNTPDRTMIARPMFAFAATLAGLAAAGSAHAKEHVNVVIIYADDLGWGDLGCYGHEKFKTPNLDRLAAEGARLTNFYSCCPYCAPSRAGLQTGRYQLRNGMPWNPAPDEDKQRDEIGLPPEEITLAEVFKQAGYATACYGKWHLGHQPPFHPLKQGYDEYLGILYSNDMRPVQLLDGTTIAEYPVYQATLTRRYTHRALDFIERNKDKPFFLYLPHAMPHKPLSASEDYYKKSGAGLYGDVISELDWGIGQVIDKIKGLNLQNNTLVFFTSDNGPWYGGSTGGLRGMKGRTWEGGIREPLITWWPGKIPPGRVSDEPAINLDLFTTSIKAAGLSVPDDRTIDGLDIMPLLTSEAKTPHEALFSISGDVVRSVRSGKWKLHVASPGPKEEKVWRPDEKWIDPRGPDGVTILAPCEQAHPSAYPGLMTGDAFDKLALFDLDTDAAEQHNVAEQHPDVVARLQKLVAQFQESLAAEPPRTAGS